MLYEQFDDHMTQECDQCGKTRVLYNVLWDIVEQDVKSNYGTWTGDRQLDRDFCSERCQAHYEIDDIIG